MTTRGTTVVS